MQSFKEYIQPKTLCITRHLINSDDILDWARGEGIKSILEPSDMHTTVTYSKEPFDYSHIKPHNDNISVKGGNRELDAFDDGNAIVLKYQAPELHQRWKEMRDAGASYDFDEYNPHVTLSYNGKEDGLDLSKIVPYHGELIFGPEKFKEVNPKWDGKAEHIKLDY